MVYEWKHVLCGKRGNYGHEMKMCRKFLKEEKEKQKVPAGNKDHQEQGNENSKEINNENKKEVEARAKNDAGKGVNQYKQVTYKQDNQQGFKTGKHVAKRVIVQNATIKLRNTFSSIMEKQLIEEKNKNSGEPSSSIPEGVQGARELRLGRGGGIPYPNG